MVEPPRELDGARVLKYAVVTPDVEPTGATRHWVGGVDFGPAAALAIARYPKEYGTYFLYPDHDGLSQPTRGTPRSTTPFIRAAFEYRRLD